MKNMIINQRVADLCNKAFERTDPVAPDSVPRAGHRRSAPDSGPVEDLEWSITICMQRRERRRRLRSMWRRRFRQNRRSRVSAAGGAASIACGCTTTGRYGATRPHWRGGGNDPAARPDERRFRRPLRRPPGDTARPGLGPIPVLRRSVLPEHQAPDFARPARPIRRSGRARRSIIEARSEVGTDRIFGHRTGSMVRSRNRCHRGGRENPPPEGKTRLSYHRQSRGERYDISCRSHRRKMAR